MSKKRKNAGEGYGYMFSGAFKEKKDAVRKEKTRKGSFIKGVYTPQGHRYVVMTPRTNPRKTNSRPFIGPDGKVWHSGKRPKPTVKDYTLLAGDGSGRRVRRATMVIFPDGHEVKFTEKLSKREAIRQAEQQHGRGNPCENPTELLVMGANPTDRELTIPAGSTITIRMNPARANWMGSARSAIRQTQQREAEERFQEHMRSRKRVAFASQPKERKRFKWERGSKRAANPETCGAMIGGYPCTRKPGHRGPHLPQGATMRPKSRLRRGWNPSAAALHERFTGAEGKWLTIHDEPHMPAGDYAQLGELLALYFKPRNGGQVQQITFSKGSLPLVVAAESARQIYFVGGNQALSSFATGELGECRRIDYKQRKEHVPDPDADEWRHAFGEESGVRPVLSYDARNKRLLLEGGEYRIESAGIIN